MNNKKRLISFSISGWIALITVIVSIAALFLWQAVPSSINWLALKPSNILAGNYLWTLVTHIFVHGGITHLIVNMLAFLSLGGLCEKIIGRKRFLWFYLISGVFAGILSVLFAGYFGWNAVGQNLFGSPDMYMVGASGAIFAVAGLFVVLLPKLRFTILFFPFFSLPALVMVPLVLLATWLVSAWGGFAIGNVAHLGGFIAGIGYGFYLRVKYKRKVELIQRYFR